MLRFPLDENAEMRLLMRHDIPALTSAVQDNMAFLQQFLPFFAHDGFNEESAKNIIQHSLDQLAALQGVHCGLFDGDRLIGGVNGGFWDWSVRSGELGYWLAEDAQGRGLATKAVQALTDYSFGTLGLNRLSITMDIENLRSVAVPERVGYRYETTLSEFLPRDEGMYDAHVYYLLADDWDGPHTPGYQLGMGLLHFPLAEATRLELLMSHHAAALAVYVRGHYNDVNRWWMETARDFDDSNALQTIKDHLDKLSSNKGLTFAMMDGDRLVGWIGLRHGIPIFRQSQIKYLISDVTAYKKPLIEAINALTDYGFDRLNLNRIEIHAERDDQAGIGIANQAGYHFEGIQHQTLLRDGIPVDAAIYVKLANKR